MNRHNSQVDVHDHTPGPWTFDINEEEGVVEVNGKGWYAHTTVVVRSEDETENNKEGLSNALLIVEAPQILADRDMYFNSWQEEKNRSNRIAEKASIKNQKLQRENERLERLVLDLLAGKRVR